MGGTIECFLCFEYAMENIFKSAKFRVIIFCDTAKLHLTKCLGVLRDVAYSDSRVYSGRAQRERALITATAKQLKIDINN